MIPTLMSDKTQPGAKGITAQPARLKTIVTIGAIKKTILFDLLGIIFSFTSNFSASAKL